MLIKTRNVLQEDFEFILKLTRRNMERIVTDEWNADWVKDVEHNFVNAWKMQGEKKIIEEDNHSIGYFWFEQHRSYKNLFQRGFQQDQKKDPSGQPQSV
jgi:hypothetical protein